MLLHMLTTLVLMGAPALSVDEAFEILKKPRRVTEAELYEAKKTIERGCPDGDEACIRRLMEKWTAIWERRERGSSGFWMTLACKKADDKTLPIILDAVRRVLDYLEKEKPEHHGVPELFGQAGITLSKRLKDPEPLLQLALETGHSVAQYRCSPPLKDKYLLEEIRQMTANEGGFGPGGYGANLSDDGIPALRTMMREMYQADPRSTGVWCAIGTLAQLSDTEIIPDLEAILASWPFEGKRWLGSEERVRKYLAKLKYQHSPADLMRIVETERDWSSVLSWAVRRLLWLKTDLASIHKALSKNRRLSEHGRAKGMDISAGHLYTLFGEGSEFYDHPVHGRVQRVRMPLEGQLDLLIFDRNEFRQYHRDRALMAEKSRELDAEEEAILRAARLAPDFDYEEQRKNPGKWGREHPEEVRRLAEIAAAKKALWHETMDKYTLKAILDATPPGPVAEAGD